MTVHPNFALQAETTLRHLNFDAMKMVMLHQAQEYDLPIIENNDTCVCIQMNHGCLRFKNAADGIRTTAFAAQQDWLFMLKEGLVWQLEQFSPDTAAQVRWSDVDKAGGLPPNFHFATVQSVRWIGASFIRVRIKAKGLSSFQDDAIHFRIVLPPADLGDVEWPHVSENGSTVWPTGAKTLHKPVYTTRWIDHAQGVMDFDVFVHEGGRVTDWASSVAPGAQVAFVGPGGGGIPKTDRILMFADETALPATARIMETLPADTNGHVTVLASHEAYCSYAITAPAGVSVSWLDRETGHSLADIAIEMRDRFPEHYVWFACEKADARRFRTAYKAKGGDPANAYIAAYWSRR
ncbi:siderophore-interacting protein [Ruegeria halocynthiae]|uniref:siderophore-interacting protein n=1 Tax=Ruegeria halocynthiae TaxID=985054 RepID=UPI000566F80D|nr:siderophore-interacting protein [Ruegeria halocynthiae]